MVGRLLQGDPRRRGRVWREPGAQLADPDRALRVEVDRADDVDLADAVVAQHLKTVRS